MIAKCLSISFGFFKCFSFTIEKIIYEIEQDKASQLR